MKIAVYQTIIGTGGGNDQVLFSLLEKLKDKDVTVFCEYHKIDLPVKIVQLLPFKLPFFGLYQNLLRIKTPKIFSKFDEIHVLTGNMIYNTTKVSMTYYNQNNFGNIITGGKYEKGFWKMYYFPYSILLKRFKKQIKKSNVKFISNSNYASKKLMQDFGISSTVQYPTLKDEFVNLDLKSGLITLSRFSPEKNLGFTLKVFDKLGGGKVYANVNFANTTYYNKLSSNSRSAFHINEERKQIIFALASAKVYFHSAVETFGISVVEAMLSGCIPIVPNNSAHLETVPFNELRYIPDSLDDALDKVNNALAGKYDYLLPDIKTHARNFIK